MPFGEDQYRKYLELARETIDINEYIQKAWAEILPENPRVCRKHKNLGFREPQINCDDCIRYNKNMIEKTIDNLVRCGFLKKNRGYICPTHNIKKKGEMPKPSDDCPDCKPYKGKLCDYHKSIGFIEPDSNCTSCKEGYVSLELYPNGKKWLDKNLRGDFSQLVLKSLKIGWGYQMRLPNAIDANLDLLSVLNSLELNETISGTEIYKRVGTKYDFNVGGEGSRRSLREFLKLLVEMKAIENIGRNNYSIVDRKKFENIKKSLSNVNMIKIVENIIDNYGPKVQLLFDINEDQKLKILLSKYYIYVQSGGIGKDQWFLRKIHKALFNPVPKDSPIELSTGRKIRIDEHKVANQRKLNRDKIFLKWKSILTEEENSALNNLADISALNDIFEAKTEKDVHFLLDSYSSKFSRSILDRLCHDNGIYNFPEDFKPFDWQVEAVAEWINGEGKEKHEPFNGIVSVVTGAGKTVMALLAIQEFFQKFPDAKVSVIVPTRVLMYQWARDLSKLLAIPSYQIGFRGDGFKESFINHSEKKILILIVNSAIQDNFLKNDITKLDKELKHLLIADECHRYTGEKFKKIFQCRRDANLGLSATPIEREEYTEINIHNPEDLDSSILIDELGPIYFELNYRKALEANLISKFSVNYIGVELTFEERQTYDNYTKALAKVLEKIRLRYGNRLDLMESVSLDQKLQVILKNDEKPDSAISQYFRLVRERRNVVYDAINRKGAYYNLLEKAIMEGKKTIVFHEKIDQLEEIVSPVERRKYVSSGRGRDKRSDYEQDVDKKLEALLYKNSYRPVMYHSGHEKDVWNRWAMDWFQDGTANTMLSVKALIEGIDVPEADVGIVRVSSSSVRQRIQATGRILRRLKDKHSEMYVIFVMKTVDENIFNKYDWQKELGSSEIKYYHWIPVEENLTLGKLEEKELGELPRKEKYEDKRPPLEIDVSNLKVGDEYPGRFAGDFYHVTADGRPYKRSQFGRIFINTKEFIKAGQLIREIKGGGKLIVTPQGNMVTMVKGQGPIFLGVINPDLIRVEVKQKIESITKVKNGKMKLERPPTFEELFGNGA